MKRVTFSIGLSNSKGEPIPQTLRSVLCDKTYAYLVDRFGGYTVTEVSGGWKDSVGKEYREEGLDICVNTDRLNVVDMAAEYLAMVWDQEAVMVTVESIESMRYVGKERIAA